MELGATVCVPNTEPKCGECPIAGACLARRAVQAHAAAGGDPAAADAPRCSDYPTKVGRVPLLRVLLWVREGERPWFVLDAGLLRHGCVGLL